MKTDIYTLYLVTDRFDYTDDEFFSIIEEACQAGVTLVQLREKKATTNRFFHLAQKVKTITDKYDVPLIINDRVDICLAVDAAGVHIGDDELPIDVARSLIGPDKLLGVSADTLERANEAQQLGADYLGIGAVFPSSTKADCETVSLDIVRQINDRSALPSVAIGGINQDNITQLEKTGITGISLVSAIMQADNVSETTGQLLQQVRAITS
ncbi:thiamine phosphate synthase [Dolosigranulum pigrum]|uniref:thiamine phosphate synthase n=1 Tax=Dolosigranulum pigrum TaxID=29394 RepID=UPI000DC5772D|nr:thiamine phosphate synthase [Dolosigranulum pigrum]QJS98290.1 thiamine phosphate synthase [Dolosigranulum pigrum]QTJ53404.1 thiamine phosphate synthase [Dolosigranulum pigrum]RAN51921.1 thiamine-phosphate diphosphorylase [Dolosigranulum pigrum]